MLTRRQFLERSLKTSSLVALSSLVPGFVAATARAAKPGKDSVLVVVEMTGGNDGLNTAIPFGDDLYHKARPTIHYTKEQIVKVNDDLGLNPSMRNLEPLLQKGELAVVQGVGYPNPDRSHFESMDIWQSADPRRKTLSGWLGRGMGLLEMKEGHIPAIYVGEQKLPLALQGGSTGVPSVHPNNPYDLDLGGAPGAGRGRIVARGFAVAVDDPPKPVIEKRPEDPHKIARMKLIKDLADLPPGDNGMLQFVQRSSLQTYTTIDRLREITQQSDQNFEFFQHRNRRYSNLARDLGLVGRMIQAGFGTRLFYVSIDGFDTHARQRETHDDLLAQVADATAAFFDQLKKSGQADRVLLMTFSEFGRRVQENGSKGTDHGAASCLLVAGPGVKGGAIGKHPSLAKDDLDAGDLKFHTDFRQVYASLLDDWLGCDSERVLGGKFEHVALLK